MRKPLEHTLTPEERATFDKWLVGVSIFYASVALLAVVFVIAGQYFGGSTRTETAAVSRTR